jgi:hypothetical protein
MGRLVSSFTGQPSNIPGDGGFGDALRYMAKQRY